MCPKHGKAFLVTRLPKERILNSGWKERNQNYRIEFRPFVICVATIYLVWGRSVFQTLPDSENSLSLLKPVPSFQSTCSVLIHSLPALGTIVCCTFLGYCCGLYRGTVSWHLRKEGLGLGSFAYIGEMIAPSSTFSWPRHPLCYLP